MKSGFSGKIFFLVALVMLYELAVAVAAIEANRGSGHRKLLALTLPPVNAGGIVGALQAFITTAGGAATGAYNALAGAAGGLINPVMAVCF